MDLPAQKLAAVLKDRGLAYVSGFELAAILSSLGMTLVEGPRVAVEAHLHEHARLGDLTRMRP